MPAHNHWRIGVVLMLAAGLAACNGKPEDVGQGVVQGVPEVKTPAVGWKGVVGRTSGAVTAIGLTATNASCVLGSTTL